MLPLRLRQAAVVGKGRVRLVATFAPVAAPRRPLLNGSVAERAPPRFSGVAANFLSRSLRGSTFASGRRASFQTASAFSMQPHAEVLHPPALLDAVSLAMPRAHCAGRKRKENRGKRDGRKQETMDAWRK